MLFLLVIPLSRPAAQSGTDDSKLISSEFDMKSSPQWLKDLRRAEIVAVGSFPIMYLFTNFGIDGVSLAANGWVMPPQNDRNKKFKTIGIAAGGSVLVALIDYTIVLAKRKRQQREVESLPSGTPIIIRKPMYEDESDHPDANVTAPPAPEEKF